MSGTGVLRGRDVETFATISLTGSTGRSLSIVEVSARTIRFTGTLGQSVSLTLPLSPTEDKGRTYSFENACLGGFTLTLLPVAGGLGVDLAADGAVMVYYDGTDLISQGGGATSIPASVGGTSTLYPLVITDPVIGDAITFDGTGAFVNSPAGVATMAIGSNVTSGTVGSVLFVGAGPVLAQDNANFFWADSTNRLGIGTNAPNAPLHVVNDSAATLATFKGAGLFSSVFLQLGDNAQAAALRVYPGVDATAGVLAVTNGGLILRGHYWNGSSSQPLDGWWRLRIDDNSPLKAYLTAGINAEDYLHIRSDGQITLGANDPFDNVGVTQAVVLSGTLFVNSDVTMNALADFVLDTGTGTKWGTATDQKQAWWGKDPRIQGVVSGATTAQRLASLEQLLGSYGLLEEAIPVADMLFDFNSDAIAGLADNANLSSWTDSAPTPHNMVSPGTNGGTVMKYRNNATDNINGHPVAQTAAGNQAEIPFPNFSPVVNDQSFTLYYVGRYTAAQAGHGILMFNYTTGGQDIISLYLSGDLVGANQVGYEFNVGGGPVDVDLGAAANGVQLITYVFDKTGGSATAWRNGTQIGTSANEGGVGAGNGFDWGNDFVEFFALAGGSNTLVGDHARIIGYQVAHDTATRQKIEAALRATYGIV